MQKRLSSVLVVAVALLGVTSWMSAGEGEKGPSIVGSWTAKRGTNTMNLEFTKDFKFTLSKDRGDKSESFTGTYKTDAKAKPQTIDMSVTGGTSDEAEKFKGKVSLGIIKVEGEKLEWCANEPGKDIRPKIFANKDGANSFLYLVLERVKK